MEYALFFNNIKTIAMVGLSDKPDRDSYQVAQYLQNHGYLIIPVNPNIRKVLGEKSYPDLLSIPKDIRVGVVDIFRKSELVLPHVQEAIKRDDAKTIWMQLGVVNNEAAKLAKENGLKVIMDKCMRIEHRKVVNSK